MPECHKFLKMTFFLDIMFILKLERKEQRNYQTVLSSEINLESKIVTDKIQYSDGSVCQNATNS